MDESIVRAVHALAERRNQDFVNAVRHEATGRTSIVHSKASGSILRMQKHARQAIVEYTIHYEWLHKRGEGFYVEERQELRRMQVESGEVLHDEEVVQSVDTFTPTSPLANRIQDDDEYDAPSRKTYNRREAVRYAERWWNDSNSAYHSFSNNCTNYISQCLHAGGAPMRNSGQKGKGWWYNGSSWSYSWTVAHAFRWFLSGSTSGLRGEEKATAQELQLGDVICYDFTGDGRWQHTTIVVAKDDQNEPLVNAQTVNSRMRFWTYEDSTAWTPEIKYKFFRIIVT